MRDKELFTKLLKLESPWFISEVVLHEQDQEIELCLNHHRNPRFKCPKCDVTLPIYDHLPVRRWRELDTTDWKTWLVASVPRVSCLFHGIRQVRVPWALPQSRFTKRFERKAIDTLLEADVLGTSRLLCLTWDQSFGIMSRAVERGLKAKRRRIIPYLAIDEKAYKKGHRYLTLVSDLKRGTVEYIAFDRKKSSLDEFYQRLTTKQRQGVQAVAMDMWDPFIRSTKEHIDEAASKIVFDRFHIMKHMTTAVDKVRKSEHRRLMEEGDETLKHTKYWWLYSAENLPEQYAEEFARLRELNLKTGRAWAIKESLRRLWEYQQRGWGERYWKSWYFWATHSALPPVVATAKLIQRHLENVLTYYEHRITNAFSEGMNSKIQTIKKTLMGTATESICGSRSISTAVA